MRRPGIASSAAVLVLMAALGLGVMPAARARAATRPIGHVFVINLENEDYAAAWGPESRAPYLSKTLRRQGVLLARYYGVAHHSLPDYIAQISGQGPSDQTQADCPDYTEFVRTGTGAFDQALGDGCVYPASVQTIADQLDAAGLTWKAYQEGIGNSTTTPTACRRPKLGAADPTFEARRGDQYATRHNPFMYFHSVIDSPACAAKVVPLDALTRDVAAVATTPALSYITPNLCNDGHDDPCVDGRPGGLVAADKWLRVWVPKILHSPAFRQDGMLVITFDEAEHDDARVLRISRAAQRRTRRNHGTGWRPRRHARAVTALDTGIDEPRRRTTTTRCCAASKMPSGSSIWAMRRSRGWRASVRMCTAALRRRRKHPSA